MKNHLENVTAAAVNILVTENAKVYGVTTDAPEHNLARFLDEMDNVYHNIPFEYRPSAMIHFEPYHDCAGDVYEQVRVTYERPETPDETSGRLAGEYENWSKQLEQARKRVAYCIAQIDALPVERSV